MSEVMLGKRRKWWIAVLLNVPVPGLGQFYNGQAAKGILFFFSFWVIGALSLLAMIWLPFPPYNIAIPVLILMSAYLFIMTDGIITTRKLGDTYQPKDHNKWHTYLIVIAIAVFGVQPVLWYATRSTLVQAYQVTVKSMLPILMRGDYILVEMFTYYFKNPERGDVIVFKFPPDEERDFIKRVIGLQGETIELRNNQVFVDGSPLREPYAIHLKNQFSSDIHSPQNNFGPLTVPEQHLFVLGDNLDHSYDSRHFGFLARSKIKGKARTIYWSWDPDIKQARWERIGRAVHSL